MKSKINKHILLLFYISERRFLKLKHWGEVEFFLENFAANILIHLHHRTHTLTLILSRNTNLERDIAASLRDR